ncbi:hypothetical protein Acr_07g0017770 [Actinidia rufa]|uniref:Uncharacterized protein n=1 Tax=Actinidia rufa TaxID=165716 RepID=A0A7J0EYR1_9ERIC|nr:hypothetical protein Acr_07g0017770 [Actinidia rufa]
MPNYLRGCLNLGIKLVYLPVIIISNSVDAPIENPLVDWIAGYRQKLGEVLQSFVPLCPGSSILVLGLGSSCIASVPGLFYSSQIQLELLSSNQGEISLL